MLMNNSYLRTSDRKYKPSCMVSLAAPYSIEDIIQVPTNIFRVIVLYK